MVLYSDQHMIIKSAFLPAPVGVLFQVLMRARFLNGQGVILEPAQKQAERYSCFPRKGQDAPDVLATLL